MRISQFNIQAAVFQEICEALVSEIMHLHTYQSGDTFLLAGEEYRLRTNSYQSYYVAVRRDASSVFVEVNCGGGGEGIFRISWGSEHAFISVVRDLVTNFCEHHGIDFEEVEVR
ncbi:MAG: DUF6054 family protein [Bacteroidia bacterium]|jgi:hypothetical protein|nr:DUF6054 family protein [Bacteroidia bacterium]